MGKGLQILGEFGGSTISVDSTLTTEGMAADAKAVGDGLAKKLSIPETASVGQTIVVSEVDANGKPTAWAPADLPDLPTGGGGSNEWKLIRTVTIPEDITTDTSGVAFKAQSNGGVLFAFDTDENGESFAITEMLCEYNASCTLSNNTIASFRKVATPGYRASGQNTVACTIGKTGVKIKGWFKIENGVQSITFGAYNVGSSLTPLNAYRWVQNIGTIKALSFMFVSGNNDGFEAGSTFTFYGR